MTRRPTRRLAALLVAVPLGLSACSGGDVDAPEVDVTPGDIDAPEVNAPDVNAPEVNAPDVDVPDVDADVDVDSNGGDTGEGAVDNAQ